MFMVDLLVAFLDTKNFMVNSLLYAKIVSILMVDVFLILLDTKYFGG